MAQLRATRPPELQGRVVLFNFCTLTCINWLRQEPYVRAWSQAYRDEGLVVIGVHTPEFSFEHEIDRVRQATEDRAIDYPVALDSDYAIWNALSTTCPSTNSQAMTAPKRRLDAQSKHGAASPSSGMPAAVSRA